MHSLQRSGHQPLRAATAVDHARPPGYAIRVRFRLLALEIPLKLIMDGSTLAVEGGIHGIWWGVGPRRDCEPLNDKGKHTWTRQYCMFLIFSPHLRPLSSSSFPLLLSLSLLPSQPLTLAIRLFSPFAHASTFSLPPLSLPSFLCSSLSSFSTPPLLPYLSMSLFSYSCTMHEVSIAPKLFLSIVFTFAAKARALREAAAVDARNWFSRDFATSVGCGYKTALSTEPRSCRQRVSETATAV